MHDITISTAALAERLDDPEVRVVDVRWALSDDDAGERAYRAGHVPGAVYLHWYRDWSDPEDPTPGQLPPAGGFARAMGNAGISRGTTVVAYDAADILMASRLVWALEYYGHEAAYVLDGGWPAWVREGRPVSQDLVVPSPATFVARPVGAARLTKADVLVAVERRQTLLDCRIDATWDECGQHIPGARRFPATALLDEAGAFLDAVEIRRLAAEAGVEEGEPVVLYCGGGVSASAAYLALRAAGFRDLAVYDGSWSEWGADPSTPKEAH